MNTCPHCGAPLREERLGVPMSVLKARIFDAAKRGAPRELLLGINKHYKAHINQINDALAGSGFKLWCGKGNTRGGYKLVREEGGGS